MNRASPCGAARRRRPIAGHWLLSHHFGEGPDGWDRCICVPLGRGRMVPLCARCLAIYPLAFVLLVAGALGIVPLERLDGLCLWLLPLPAFLEAVSDWMGWRRGTNATRMATGVLLGIALARLFHRFLLDPGDSGVWSILFVYGVPATLAAVKGARGSRGRAGGPGGKT